MFTTKYATPEAKAQARSIRRKVRAAKKSGNAAELAKWQAALLALQTVPAEEPAASKAEATTEAKADEVKAEPEKADAVGASTGKLAKTAKLSTAIHPAPKPGKKTAKK